MKHLLLALLFATTLAYGQTKKPFPPATKAPFTKCDSLKLINEALTVSYDKAAQKLRTAESNVATLKKQVADRDKQLKAKTAEISRLKADLRAQEKEADTCNDKAHKQGEKLFKIDGIIKGKGLPRGKVKEIKTVL